MAPLTLTTPRLVLRDLRSGDYEAFREFDGDPEVQRYEAPVPTPEQTRLFLGTFIEMDRDEPRSHYHLAITCDGQMVGRLSLSLQTLSIREWEIGWTVRRVDWGKGYATEAAREVLRFVFEQLNAHRVVAFCHDQNAASYRVMEKLGMRREGRLRETRRLNDCWADELIYGILEQEFQYR